MRALANGRALIAAVALLVAACSSGYDSPTTPGTNNGGYTGGTTTGTDHAVTISGSAFAPVNLTVAAGTTVQWTNKDNIAHTVTADDGSFGSAHLANGGTFTQTFAAAGTYSYHCSIHPSMTAQVTVQ